MKRLVIAVLAGTVAGALLSSQLVAPLIAQESTNNPSTTYQQLDRFGDIFERVNREYVEPVDDEELIKAAINGMLTSLDPHSSYLDPKSFEAMQVQTRGSFGGLGIEVTQEDGIIKVIAPIDETPAQRAGVEAGDFITHVDGESVLGLTLEETVGKMRGPVGSDITITVLREGVADPFDILITRDTIKLTAVRSRAVDNTIVLRLTTFNEQTFAGLEKAVNEEVEALGGIENVDGFVVDLRNNPGGLLNQAIMVSDAFLERGEIVSTRARRANQGNRFNAQAGDLTEGKPVVVLVNGGSASASEIVAGALQDHKRAIVVGTKTFGKGSVQTIVPLRDGGGAMRLTTARYYTPSGRSIQALGVMPDIVVNQPRRDPNAEPEADEKPASAALAPRSEAGLRGSLSNDSMTDEERALLEEERSKIEESAALRAQDYQLAYAVDIIRGLAIVEDSR